MRQSQRKLAGAFLLPISIVGWAWLATWIYVDVLAGTPWWIHLPYFVVAGMGWLLPAIAIVRWMARPD